MSGFELIEDVESERKLIERIIRANGGDAEHNYGYFAAHENEDEKCIFIRNRECGIQATFNPQLKKWMMIGEPIAPDEKKARFLYSALDFLSEKGKMKKFIVEFEPEKRKEVASMEGGKYDVHSPNCVLYWPVYHMPTWTGHDLKGGQWKKLRNLINRVTKNHRVEMVDAGDVRKDELKGIVSKWAKLRNQTGFAVNRKYSNRTDYDHYLRLVDLDFAGCTFAKAVKVDGKAASLTVGWEIPNRKGEYYSGIGVYDLSIPHLGEYANWSDLAMLKGAGYAEVNFGGSPKSLLQFKMKFKPARTYTTYIFAITKKKKLQLSSP